MLRGACARGCPHLAAGKNQTEHIQVMSAESRGPAKGHNKRQAACPSRGISAASGGGACCGFDTRDACRCLKLSDARAPLRERCGTVAVLGTGGRLFQGRSSCLAARRRGTARRHPGRLERGTGLDRRYFFATVETSPPRIFRSPRFPRGVFPGRLRCGGAGNAGGQPLRARSSLKISLSSMILGTG